ncbi:MAG TPA: TetR/AcrR family transcriptional regulator [Clostridia bacterium]|nr:TetR/AcrR family transcriptional regulator [Clostridia bacterium]
MQYKKDEIKGKIDAAALAVFAEKGYKGAKISDIGERAGVSVGNIYRYYGSKDDIFYAIISESFIEDTKGLLKQKIEASEGRDSLLEEQQDSFWLVNEEVIDFMVENRRKLIIVFEKSEGTKYEKAKSELVEFILVEVRKSMAAQSGTSEIRILDSFTAGIIYKNLIDMVLGIMEESTDSETARRCLRAVNTYHMFGISGFVANKGELYGY